MQSAVAADEAPQLLTVPEVAELLRMSRSAVRGMCAKGLLPATKIGGVYRIRRLALLAGLELSPHGYQNTPETPAS